MAPFTFEIGDQRYTVGYEDMASGVAGSLAQAALVPVVGEEFARDLTRGGERVPDEFDVNEWVNDFDEERVAGLLSRAGRPVSEDVDALYSEFMDLVGDRIADTVDGAHEKANENLGLIIDLEDIGKEAELAGYKAVSLEGARGRFPDEEVLVFDASDLKLLGEVDSEDLMTTISRNPTTSHGTRFAYHVTERRFLSSILDAGIRSRKPEGDVRGVYLFPSVAAMEDALMGWFGDKLPDGPITVLKVDLSKISSPIESDVGYELRVMGDIPPEAITVTDMEQNPKIVGGVQAYAAAGVSPNGDVVSLPRPPERVTIGSRSYALSNVGVPAISTESLGGDDENGPRIIHGGGRDFRYIWIYTESDGRLDMYRYSDGEWKVLGNASDYPQTFVKLRESRQLNTVSDAEAEEFEAAMRVINLEAFEAIQAYLDEHSSDEQKRVDALVKIFYEKEVIPTAESAWSAIDVGVFPISFRYDKEFADRSGVEKERQAKTHALNEAIARSGFGLDEDSPLEEFVVRGLGLRDAGELEDIQSIHWAYHDVLHSGFSRIR
ncbi:MAG: hypothetical protein DRH30_15040 [Deltaproteobacteria bacterium]|nr:MAG: hypothetical protein DRH30_15040 [Deltaproteobacteria bacterium]